MCIKFGYILHSSPRRRVLRRWIGSQSRHCVRILGPAGMMRPDDLAHKWSTGPGAANLAIKHIGKRSSSTRCWPGFTSIVRVSTLTNYFSISVKRADQTSCRLSHHSADKWNFCKTHPKSISILDGAIMKLKVCSMLFAKLWSTFLLLKKMWLHIITDNFQWKNRSKSLNPPNF